MGNEVTCNVQFGKQQSEGKALLETSEILFRGEFRLKIPFSAIKSAKAVDRRRRRELLCFPGRDVCRRRREWLRENHLGAHAPAVDRARWR